MAGGRSIIAIGLVAGLSLMAARAQDAAASPAILALSTGEVTGLYYPLGGAICRLVNKDTDRHGQRCLVEPTSGSAANLVALRAGETDMAVTQSRAHQQAFRGEGAFADAGAFADMRSLASLNGEALLVLVAKQAKVKSLRDLKGKKVNLGRPNSFQRLMAEAALSAASVETAGFSATLEMDLAQQKQALCDGGLDVAFFSGLHPMPMVQDALSDCEVDVIDLGAVDVGETSKKAAFLAPHRFSADIYDGLQKDVQTFAMKATLVASTKMSEEVAYRIVKVVLDNFDAFTSMHPFLARVEKGEMAEAALAAPLHEGAVRAYREAGIRP